MSGNDSEVKAVAPVLGTRIQKFDKKLNIVERPSVGTLAIPLLTCKLIDAVLKHSLGSFKYRKTQKVYVLCRRLTPRELMLEVTADRAWPPRNELQASFALSELNMFAHRLNGEITIGGVANGGARQWRDVYYRLIVPIPA